VSGQRIFNMIHLPYWDQKALEIEARRCIDMGLKGFVVPDTPERVGVPSFMHDYWTPFLEMCDATGTSLNFHINAAIDPNVLTWEGFEFEQQLSVVATMFSIGNAATLGNWMVSGRLDQHPNLKIGLIESGLGWLTFAIEALEHQFQEMLPAKRNILKKQPWDYFRDHFMTTFWFEKIAPKYLLEHIGVDNIMFETDFPHPTSLYPGVQAHLKDVFADHSHETRKKVLQDNAVRFYNLDIA
jgi:predicted TIM-barrel fold metal-dependent hydrolase